jgi:hypothetical protein
VQRQDQAGRFGRQRGMAEILGAQLGEAEFFLAGHFPQEFEIDIGGDRLGLLQQFGGAGFSYCTSTSLTLTLVRLPLGISTW